MLFTKYFHIKLIAVLLTCSSIVVFGQSVSEMKRAQMTKQKSKQVNKPAMRTEEAIFDAMRACMERCDQLSREECMNQCWDATSGVSANVVTRGDSQERAEGNDTRCVQGQGEGDRCETQLRRSPSNQEGSTNASNERRGEERGEDRNSPDEVNGVIEVAETRSGQTPSNTVSINNNSERNDSEKSKSKDSEDPSKALEN